MVYGGLKCTKHAHDGPCDESNRSKDPEHKLDEADEEVGIETVVSRVGALTERTKTTAASDANSLDD